MLENKCAVVVGGGISGILSALKLRKKYASVYLVESENSLGGLLRSRVDEQGNSFDYGTHLLMESGVDSIDELLFDFVFENESDWQFFSFLRSGSFFNGQHNTNSGCIDIRSFEPDIYNRIIIDMLHGKPHQAQSEGERIAAEYGDTLKQKLFAPIIRNHLGADIDELAVDSSMLLIPPYLIALNEVMSEHIKQSEYFNKIFAFHTFKKRVATSRSFYPKAGKGGMGFWVKQITEKLHKSGVTVLTGETVEKVTSAQGRVTAVNTSSREIDNVDLMVWTVPTFHYLRACGTEFKAARPNLRKMLLCHLSYQGQLLTDMYYTTNFDVSKTPFRLTFYTNLNPEHTGDKFHLTAEVFVDDDYDEAALIKKLDVDLREMGIISRGTVLMNCTPQFISAGFPIPTIEFNQSQAAQLEMAKEINNNVLFAGRANGGFFLQNQLQETNKLLDF